MRGGAPLTHPQELQLGGRGQRVLRRLLPPLSVDLISRASNFQLEYSEDSLQRTATIGDAFDKLDIHFCFVFIYKFFYFCF